MMSIYAIIQDGKVGSLLDWDGNGESPLPGQALIEVEDGVSCNIGDYYNPKDSLFYVDDAFTILSGYVPPITAEEAYSTANSLIDANSEMALKAIEAPFFGGNQMTWMIMAIEVERMEINETPSPSIISSMVEASGGSWSLDDLTSIMKKNHSLWKDAAGKIMGQVKVKRSSLDSLKKQVLSGKAKVDEMIAFDTSIESPSVQYDN